MFLVCSFWFFIKSVKGENDVSYLKKIISVKRKESSVLNIWEIITHGYTLLLKLNNDGEIVFFK